MADTVRLTGASRGAGREALQQPAHVGLPLIVHESDNALLPQAVAQADAELPRARSRAGVTGEQSEGGRG